MDIQKQELIVYRISQNKSERSMWYDRNGVHSPLEEIFANIPMPEDARKDLAKIAGGDWLSSVEDPALLKLWFPNMGKLFQGLNFKAEKFIVQEWVKLPNEIVFKRETARIEKLDMDLVNLLEIE